MTLAELHKKLDTLADNATALYNDTRFDEAEDIVRIRTAYREYRDVLIRHFIINGTSEAPKCTHPEAKRYYGASGVSCEACGVLIYGHPEKCVTGDCEHA